MWYIVPPMVSPKSAKRALRLAGNEGKKSFLKIEETRAVW
jgi:hypothetical protein